MSYRHPREIISNREVLDECVHDAVRCGLNEVMPEVMAEFEGVMTQKFDEMKSGLTSNNPQETQPLTYKAGVYMGLAIGSCLFIGLAVGLLIGVLI